MYLFELTVFSGYMPRSGIAGSYGSSVFSFLRNLEIVILSEISQTQKDKYHMVLLICGI